MWVAKSYEVKSSKWNASYALAFITDTGLIHVAFVSADPL